MFKIGKIFEVIWTLNLSKTHEFSYGLSLSKLAMLNKIFKDGKHFSLEL